MCSNLPWELAEATFFLLALRLMNIKNATHSNAAMPPIYYTIIVPILSRHHRHQQ